MKCVGDEHVEREAYCAWDAYRREIAEPAHCALCGQMIAYGRHCGPCGQSDYQPWGSE